MKRRTLIASIGAVAGTTLGAAAYTSATIERSATINVDNDSGALIALAPGDSEFIDETNGNLTIDVSGVGGEGVNRDATFVFGDESSLTADTEGDRNPAFSITNNGSTSRTLTLTYDIGTDPAGSTENVTFDIYSVADTDDDGTLETTLEGSATEGASDDISVGSETEFYVILTADTTGVDPDSGDDLSGTLSITA